MPKSIEKLIAGYSRFRKNYLGPSQALFKTLVENGQNPIALIIGCCDSRVDPALILDCNPGDLFVIRNVANLVPPHENDRHYHGTSAALEFGICTLNIPNIILLGHSHCGGIRSLLQDQPNQEGTFITKWMNLVDVPSAKKMEDYAHFTGFQKEELYGKNALMGSYKNLLTFPWIQERKQKRTLDIHAWYFKLETGTIDQYDPDSHEFHPLLTK